MILIPCENLWLADAARIWEQMHTPSAWDIHSDDDVLSFVDRYDLAWKIIADCLHVRECDEAGAEELFWELPKKKRVSLAEAYIDADPCLVADYTAWKKEE